MSKQTEISYLQSFAQVCRRASQSQAGGLYEVYEQHLYSCVWLMWSGSIERGRIKDALSYWEELTCVTFTENAKALFKLVFVKQSG